MTRTLAVANQKGGVAKTTTVSSLGQAFADRGLKVLLVDLDAQSCLTFSLGVDPEAVEGNLHHVLVGEAELADVRLQIAPGLDLVPAGIDLAGTELALLTVTGRESVLRERLAGFAEHYDVVLLDCSPSLGVLTLNALVAADEVLIPVQCEMLSHRGVGQLLDTVADVQTLVNPELVVRGLLPTMYDARTAHARAVLADLPARYGLPVLEPIPRSVRFAEAPAVGRSVLETSAGSRGAQAYRTAAAQLMKLWRLRSRRTTRRA